MQSPLSYLPIALGLLWTPLALSAPLTTGLTGEAGEIPLAAPGSQTAKDLKAAHEKIRQLEQEIARLRSAQSVERRGVRPEVSKQVSQEKTVQANEREVLPPAHASSSAQSAAQACAVCPELVELPRGSYKRGSPVGEAGRRDNEGPVKTVTIDYRLAVGKYAVSFAEWDACRADVNACKANPEKTYGGDRQPVINVSYVEVTTEYIPWLNRKAGIKPDDPYRFRLLSESEWEYAARGVTHADKPHPPFLQIPGTPVADGHCLHTDFANYNGNFDYNNCGAKTGVYRKATLPVDSLRPNNFGLYHMAGNVWEWVADCYLPSYEAVSTDGSPHGPSPQSCKSGQRVVRGSSWLGFPSNLRAAFRVGYSPADGDFMVGFRLARTLPPEAELAP